MVNDEMMGLYTESRILEWTAGVGVRHSRVVKGCKRATRGQRSYKSVGDDQP
jgi:hypothetical protein